MNIEMGSLSALFLEGVKWILRNWILRDPGYDFPPKFYLVAIPVLNVLLLPFVAWMIPGSVEMPASFEAFARVVSFVLVNSLISVVVYNAGIAPTKYAFQMYHLSKQYRKDTEKRLDSVLQN